MEVTNEIISSFQFVGNTIVSLKIKNDFVGFLEQDDLKRNIDVSYTDIKIDNSEDGILGSIKLVVLCDIIEVDEEDPRKFEIELVVEGCFSDDNDTSQEEFIEKLKINGCASLYSISRAIISSISAQSLALGQINLPMINVFKLLDTKDE